MEGRLFEMEGGVEVWDQGDAEARSLVERESVGLIVSSVPPDGEARTLVLLSRPQSENQRAFLLTWLVEVMKTLRDRAEEIAGLDLPDEDDGDE